MISGAQSASDLLLIEVKSEVIMYKMLVVLTEPVLNAHFDILSICNRGNLTFKQLEMHRNSRRSQNIIN